MTSDPVHPESVNPAPVNPESVHPESLNPASVNPESVNPASVSPASVNPESLNPASVSPASVHPESLHPAPVNPGSVDPEAWAGGLHQVLRRHDVSLVSYVPDAGLSGLIEACRADPDITTVTLTTEEEGVALSAGAWLGGQRSAVLMQSSGVGNCVNMLSLWRSSRIPALVIVTMRGQFGEANPWQVPMGQITPDVLRLCGLVTFEVDDPARIVETADAAATMAFAGGAACAVAIGQRAIRAKVFVAAAGSGTAQGGSPIPTFPEPAGPDPGEPTGPEAAPGGGPWAGVPTLPPAVPKPEGSS